MTLLVPWAPASAVVYTATFATINSIFSGASSGDTIRMTGTFGQTRLENMVFAKGITLDARQAVFTDTLELVHLSGVRVFGGTFDIASRVTRDSKAAVVWDGANIAFDSPVITGDASQSGISFSGVNNARVSGGKFTGLHVGIGLHDVTNGLLIKNSISKADADGINIADSHRVRATYNSCSGGTPGVGEHPDCIQLWSVAGRLLQSDIVVSDNIATGATQGFTSFTNGSEAASGIRLSFLHNTVNTSYPQGIACYGCVDSNISYNKVTTLAGSQYMTTINIVGGTNNIVTGNTIGGTLSSTSAGLLSGELDDGAVSSSTASAAGGEGLNEDLPFDFGPSPVTEPGTWAMLVAGFGLVGVTARRRTLRQTAA